MTRTHLRDLIIGLLVGAVCVLAPAGIWMAIRLNKDEATTCHVEARGLPASHDLAAALTDMNILIVARSTANPTLLALHTHLDAYLALEDKQPAHRFC